VINEYHDALGIKLLAGRRFGQHDQTDSPFVVVVDDRFVRRNFGQVTPDSILGRRLRFEGADEPWREIVGVVGHVRYHEPEEEPLVQIYRPWLQMKACDRPAVNQCTYVGQKNDGRTSDSTAGKSGEL
jgi:putative ABC transport system permease protein